MTIMADQIERADLSPVADKRKLEALHVWCNFIESVAPLASCSALTELSIEFTSVRDLAPLAALRRLASLDITGTAVEDLSPLASVPLKTLTAYRTRLSEDALAMFCRAHPECTIHGGDDYPEREVRCGQA